jgi:hypothetical protein
MCWCLDARFVVFLCNTRFSSTRGLGGRPELTSQMVYAPAKPEWVLSRPSTSCLAIVHQTRAASLSR